MRGCCSLGIHPPKSVDTLNQKSVFFLEIAKTIPVMLLICVFEVDFNFFTANGCGKKSFREFANLILKSAICGLANQFAVVPSTTFQHRQRHFETQTFWSQR